MVEVNLAELPLEVLERIVAELDPDEVSTSVSLISRRFAEVAYNVLCAKFRALQSSILERLTESKSSMKRLATVPTTFEDEMLQVSNFTFYQILHSEYKILCTVYFNRRSLEHTALVFHGVRSLKEFNKLLFGASSDFQNGNVSSLLDGLRNCNSELLDIFFRQIWNVEEDFMGSLIVRLLNCSLSSTFDFAVSHEQLPKSRSSKCHVSGKLEMTDLSNTLSSPPDGLADLSAEKAKKIFVAYICDAIRWGNLYHTLRLRWICMDKALAAGRRQLTGWPGVDPTRPYETMENDQSTVSEAVLSVYNGDQKVVRRLKKDPPPEPFPVQSTWMGTRVVLQMWCRADEAPEDMLAEGFRNALKNLADDGENEPDDNCTRPFHFKMKYEANVRALTSSIQGLVKTTVIVRETPQLTDFRQLKTIVTT